MALTPKTMAMTTIAKIIMGQVILSLLLSQIIPSAALKRRSCEFHFFPNQFNLFCQFAHLFLETMYSFVKPHLSPCHRG